MSAIATMPPASPPILEDVEKKEVGEILTVEHADFGEHSGDIVHTVDGVSWTQAEEDAIIKKTDWNVVSIIFVLFIRLRGALSSPLATSELTRTPATVDAQTAGMSKYLKMSDAQYQWLLTIGYSLGQPTTLLWKVIPPRYFVTFLTLCWGGFALLQAAARWEGLMVLRLLLGVAETAFSPGAPLYLSFFYSRREVGFRQGIFLAAAPLASCYAGTLAYGITQIKTHALPVYKVLFLVEGAPALPMAAVAWFFLPDKPSTARFLNERQRQIARLRTVRDGDTGRESGLKMRDVLEGLKDPKAWLCALMYFSCNVSYSSLPVFLPEILKDMGYSSIRAQGLSAPPYLGAFFILLVVTYASDRLADRTAFIIPLAFTSGIGYLLLATINTTAVRYFAVFLCAGGLFPVIGLMLPLVTSLHESDSKRAAAFLILNLIGQCGPFLGTRLFPKHQGPYYHKGTAICSAFVFFVAILAVVLRLSLLYLNRKRDEKYGYVDRKNQEALQEMAVREANALATVEARKAAGADAEAATESRTGKEKNAAEKKVDREALWRYML
ncbi:hypothetical protein BMF94_0832 [Rhodotorula taiwanensis]|uniref:Major facilitator superfamily (MFS) profile domain-containing protein n=1 Tax=Rhodotorula taiwanensis TaxID=741276 RepID=A0A2S5BH56_9BASI|nr:hypothetical protein BMF94_0832 [Rhodotorula taiwanensis]